MGSSGASRRVAVMGAGVSGLATAYYLGRAGAAVEVFEAEEEPGGLARSFTHDGLTVERYYHFLCRPDVELIALAGELGLGDRLRWRRTRTSFFYRGRLYPFTSPADLLRFSPIPFWSRMLMGLNTLQWTRLQDWHHLDEVSAKEWIIATLGERNWEVIWAPLLTMKFGGRHDQVSAAWVWHRIHRVANSRRSPLHPQVMGYFEGGTAVLVSRLVEAIGRQHGRLHCGTRVEAVARGNRGRLTVRTAAGEDDYDAVVMAVPLPPAAAVLPTDLTAYRAGLMQVEYIGVVCLAAWLTRGLTDSFWLNIHDPRLPMNGLIEFSNLNPATGRAGALIYVPYYLPVTAPRFAFSDEQILDEFTQALPLLRPGLDTSNVISHHVFRSPFAQAVCPVGFRQIQPPHAAPYEGLYLLDSTQQYPSDRTLSQCVRLAQKVAAMVMAGAS